MNEDKIKTLLKQLTPDQQAITKTLTLNKFELADLRHIVSTLKREYDELWKILLVVIHSCPSKELRIHQSQFLRFKEEYRLDRSWDEETGEMVVRLLTITDPMPK